MTDQTDRTTAIYDAIDAFQRTHRLPGLQHAQIRGLLAEHLARTLPVSSAGPAPATDRAGVAAVRALHQPSDMGECRECHASSPCRTIRALGDTKPATDRDGLPPEATWMFGAAEIETRPEMDVTPLPAGALAADETDVTEPEIDGMLATGVPVQIVTAPPATYAPTGHLVTCFAVAGGNPDPDCPCATEPQAQPAVLPAPDQQAACDCDAEVHMGAGFYHQPRCASRSAAPADRAAVLLEAADFVANHPGPCPWLPGLPKGEGDGFWWDTRDRDAIAAELRRMAGEAQQDEEPDDTLHACPGRWGGRGCRCFDDDQPAREAQQDPTQDGTVLAVENEALWGELHRRDTETDQPHPVARPGQPETDNEEA